MFCDSIKAIENRSAQKLGSVPQPQNSPQIGDLSSDLGRNWAMTGGD